ncbi:tail fiber protein [Bordetella ansorpii]|uniref:Tail fiber protein n=1 Tax=Bordetella ansorpii TaxID=288768 RepID=A0A157QPJ3_9BORD|nr:phage tail protein [Bordetella ansorpii]SAI47486.1 tail fiber protein [Bordetella ansorpii]
MTTKYYGVLTAIGEAKEARAKALGVPVKITHMCVGDAALPANSGETVAPDPQRTALINQLRVAQLNRLSQDATNPNWLIAEQVVPEDVGGWWIRELGLRDEDGDLVAIANCPPTYKPVLAEGSGRTQVIRIVIQVSSRANFELQLDPSTVLATRAEVEARFVDFTSAQTIAGKKTFTNELVAAPIGGTGHSYRMHNGQQGSFWRVDGESMFLMVTALGDPLGTYTAARPLKVYFADGRCDINGQSATALKWATPRTIALNGAVSGSAAVDGSTNVTLNVTGMDVSKATAGTLAVTRGGTGLATVPAGSFVQGNGTGAMVPRTPAQVLSDIGGQAALGYTPVRQGGGTGMAANTVYIGWGRSGDTSRLMLQIDASVFGARWPIDVSGTAKTLETPRQIAGRPFDGSADVVIVPADIGAAPLDSPALTGAPTAPTPATTDNSTRISTTAFVRAAIAALIGQAPGTLDTLQELADALGDDPNFSTTMTNLIATKLPLSRVQASALDTTADTILRQGAFGLGRLAGLIPSVNDVEQVHPNGMYCTNTSTAGTPPGAYSRLFQGMLVVQNYDNAAGNQIWIPHNADEVWFRRRTGGAWQPWINLVTPSNVLRYYPIAALPASNQGPVGVTEACEIWNWVSTAYFTGYRSPQCGRPVDGHTMVPLASEVDAAGGLLSKAAYAGLWGYAQENGLVVTQAVFDANVGAHLFVDSGANTFRVPDLRNQFRRFTGTDTDTNTARALGSWQKGSISTYDTDASDGAVVGVPGWRSGTLSPGQIGLDTVDVAKYPGVGFSFGPGGSGSSFSSYSGGVSRPNNVAYHPRIHI